MNKLGHIIMKKSSSRVLLASTGIATLALFASVAYAQETPKTDEDDAINFDEIVVIGVKRQIQESNALERMADNIVSAITANDMGQFPDQNVAEALQRMPGVTIIRDEGEGRFISVRGLDKSFVQVTVNNAQIGSSEGEGPDLPPTGDRSVALDIIPADLLSTVTVGKTLLPDMDHQSLGAKVDLRPLSAFNRSEKMTAKVLVQGTYTDYANKAKPKVSADFTYRNEVGDGEFGIAAAINYFERAITGDDLQSRSSGGLESRNGILLPREIEQRVELGQRNRLGATLTMDYEAGDHLDWNFSFLYGKLEDDDIRVQQEIELRDADEDETISLEQGQGRFTDVDIERQMFFQPTTEETYALHFDGTNKFSDDWTFGYAIDYSKNNYRLENGLRGRFRERDAIVDATWGEDFGTWTNVGKGDFDRPDDMDFDFRPDAGEFDFDDLLIIDEKRQDEIFAYNLDLKHQFSINDKAASIKVGLKQIKRNREFLRGENANDIDDYVGEPGGEFLPETLADIDTFVPNSRQDMSGGLAEGALFPNVEAFRDVLIQAASFTGLEAVNTRRDFTVDEDIDAAYLMGKYELSEDLNVIVGVRVERTRYQTTGTVARTADFTETEGDTNTVEIPGSGEMSFEKEYTTWLPGIHFRYEPSDHVVARLSYSKGQVRPAFGSASALQNVSFEFIEPIGGCAETSVSLDGTPTSVCIEEASLTGGNPLLDPLTADQFDFNIGWYPSDDTTLTFAAFYKDMKNVFIGTTSGGAIDGLTGIPYTNITGIINGEQGILYGAEISFQHFFTDLDGLLGNLFVTGNLSLIDSEVSDPNLRDGEKLRLPSQSDISANASIGYEDETVLVRFSVNHQGGQLRAINLSSSRLDGADLSVRDVYERSSTTLGLTARYYINENFQLFGDVNNITNSKRVRYFQGDENGHLLNRASDYGRVFTFGVVGSF